MTQTIFIAFIIGYMLGILTVISLAWWGIRIMDKPRKGYKKKLQEDKETRTKNDIKV